MSEKLRSAKRQYNKLYKQNKTFYSNHENKIDEYGVNNFALKKILYGHSNGLKSLIDLYIYTCFFNEKPRIEKNKFLNDFMKKNPSYEVLKSELISFYKLTPQDVQQEIQQRYKSSVPDEIDLLDKQNDSKMKFDMFSKVGYEESMSKMQKIVEQKENEDEIKASQSLFESMNNRGLFPPTSIAPVPSINGGDESSLLIEDLDLLTEYEMSTPIENHKELFDREAESNNSKPFPKDGVALVENSYDKADWFNRYGGIRGYYLYDFCRYVDVENVERARAIYLQRIEENFKLSICRKDYSTNMEIPNAYMKEYLTKLETYVIRFQNMFYHKHAIYCGSVYDMDYLAPKRMEENVNALKLSIAKNDAIISAKIDSIMKKFNLPEPFREPMVKAIKEGKNGLKTRTGFISFDDTTRETIIGQECEGAVGRSGIPTNEYKNGIKPTVSGKPSSKPSKKLSKAKPRKRSTV